MEWAVGAATLLAAIAGLVVSTGPIDVTRLLPVLVAFGGVSLAALTIRRAPSVAWLATSAASYGASTILFEQARQVNRNAEVSSWLLIAATASVAAIATAWIASGYATRPAARLDPIAVPMAWVLVGWVVVACLTTIAVVVAGQRTPDPAFNWIDVATVPISFFLPILVALLAFGVIADVRAAAARARTRVPATAGRSAPGRSAAERAWALAIATGRELVPGQAAAQEAVTAAERARLAGDLHAV